MYFSIILAVAAIDQLIKFIVRNVLNEGESMAVIGDFLTITLHYNTGAAFSILQGHREVLSIFPAIMIVIITVYIIRNRKYGNRFLLGSLSLIAGGGLGNLIDRVFMGEVIDYISVSSFPVFNFADMSVVSGCVLVMIYLFFIEGRKKKRPV